MKYSREGFEIWLRSLPQAETFCMGNNCPISQYLGKPGGAGVMDDSQLAYAIDDYMPDLDTDCFWERLLPSDVLRVIDSLQASGPSLDRRKK